MNVKVSAKDMDDFIWMSYRYCIGRKTIAASCHAGTIAELIFNNPKLLSKERIEQMVTDIRNEINDTIKWNKFIKFENEYSYSACMYDSTWDVYSAILTADTEFPNETQYIADFSTRTVKCEKFSKEDTGFERYDSMYTDLIGWVKLANLLDKKCHKDVVVEVDGKRRTFRCFPYANKFNGGYEMVWGSVEMDHNKKILDKGYIIPEVIVEIKDIEDE